MMVVWWAAFFIVGLISPPALFIEILATCLAAAVPAAVLSADRLQRGSRLAVERNALGARAARCAAAAAACIILWECGGMEAREHAAQTRSGASSRYSTSGVGARGGVRDAAPGTDESLIPGVARLRSYLIASLGDGRLSPAGEGIIGALVLGYRKDLGFALNETYSYLGITHFLALSGMHLGVIAVPLAKLLSLVLPARRRRDAALLAILCFYAAVANFPPSLSRALALLATVIGYRSIGLNSGLLSSLVAGCFALAAFGPAVVFDAGFQLSFAAVCGIALIGVPLSRMAESVMPGGVRGTFIRALLFPALITCSVQFLTMPITIVIFKRASLISPFVNVIVSLPFMVLLYVGVVYVFVPFGPLRAVLALPANLISRFLDVGPTALSRGPHPGIYFGDFNLVIYLAGSGLVALFFARRPRERFPYLLAGAFLVTFSFAAQGISSANGRGRAVTRSGIEDSSRVEAVSAASGAEIVKPGALYLSRGGGLLVIDERFTTHDSYRLTRELWARGARRVELCIIAAPHIRPRNGVFYFARRVSVEEVLCSPYMALSRRGFAADMGKLGARVRTVVRGDTVRTETFEVAVARPIFPPPAGMPLSSDSLRLRCTVRERPRLTVLPAVNNMLAVH
jgi:ComEC/Rec2-related protein